MVTQQLGLAGRRHVGPGGLQLGHRSREIGTGGSAAGGWRGLGGLPVIEELTVGVKSPLSGSGGLGVGRPELQPPDPAIPLASASLPALGI